MNDEYKILVDKFDEVTASVEKETNCKYICLEYPLKAEVKIEDISKEYILQVKHMLLLRKHAEPATKFTNNLQKLSEKWMGGATQFGNIIWWKYMCPQMNELDKYIEETKWSKAFGVIMGMCLYLNCEDSFIQDHEQDLSIISKWFSDYSKNWLMILRQSDEILGLECNGGISGGYREVLMELLRQQQNDLNNILKMYDDLLDDYDYKGKPPCVHIFEKGGKISLMFEDKENEDNPNNHEVNDAYCNSSVNKKRNLKETVKKRATRKCRKLNQ